MHDGRVFDLIPAVAQRYLGPDSACKLMEIWKLNRRPRSVRRGYTLRIEVPESFMLHWSKDEWQTVEDLKSTPTAVGMEYVDIPIRIEQRAPIRFTFFWNSRSKWDGQDYKVDVI